RFGIFPRDFTLPFQRHQPPTCFCFLPHVLGIYRPGHRFTNAFCACHPPLLAATCFYTAPCSEWSNSAAKSQDSPKSLANRRITWIAIYSLSLRNARWWDSDVRKRTSIIQECGCFFEKKFQLIVVHPVSGFGHWYQPAVAHGLEARIVLRDRRKAFQTPEE